MVDTKKEQEREELHRAIWAIADELRGAVDGWDFKNYVLGTMFYRYIGSIIFFVGLTLPRYRFSKPSASLDMNLR